MCSSGISWVCNFLQAPRNIITDAETNGLSKEDERDLLIILSTVCRHCQAPQDDVHHEDGRNDPTDNMHDVNWCRQGQYTTDHNCLQFATETLVMFLVLENEFVSHSAGKTLLVLSCSLVKSVSEWKVFLHYLWISLKSVCFGSDIQLICDVANSLESHAVDRMSATDDSVNSNVVSYISYWTRDIEYSNATVESTWTRKGWIAASRLMQLLRNVLKTCCLKAEKLSDIYIHVAEAYILDVACHLLNNLCFEETASSVNSSNVPSHPSERNRGYLDLQKELALGALLQLLCSLVRIILPEHGAVGGGILFNQRPIVMKFDELVPALSIQSLALHNHPEGGCISHFLRHKLMVLMIRLSDCFLQKPSTFVLWLELLWKHAPDLLGQSLLLDQKILESSLVGSPFGTSACYCIKGFSVSTSHLQRRAVFLLFKCSFIVIGEDWKTPKVQTSFDCNSVLKENETSLSQLNPISELDSQKAGAALKDWLLRQVSSESVFNHGAFRKLYNVFASIFLQLFMDEDDLLFEMLLQLLNLPLLLPQIQYNGNKELDDGECMHPCLQLLEALKPTTLFHVFLEGIQYDHSILLDYLISKGTGVLCLSYLLRCLRIICDSWPDFIEYQLDTDDDGNFSGKKRGHHLARNKPLERHTLRTLERSGSLCPGSVGLNIMVQNEDATDQSGCEMRKRKRGKQFLSMSRITTKESRFENAKRCLLSLKVGIENLHQKDLFPYNPSPLLKRFEVFMHLCNAWPGDKKDCNKN